MAYDAGEIADRGAMAAEEGIGDRTNLGAHEGGDVAGEQDAETVFLHAPSHDVERLRPGVLAGRSECGSRTFRRDDRCGRPIAEQGGGDHVAFRIVAMAKGEGTEFDHEIEHMRTRQDAGLIDRSRQAGDTAGTT